MQSSWNHFDSGKCRRVQVPALAVAALLVLTGCSRSESAAEAGKIIKDCNGTASVELHVGLFYEFIAVRCQWDKKAGT